ncbi:MAG: deoxyguanosinetriphosphate triphosphohydrolase [Micrococcales bacterium]|nr:deoxyguanosinetriphosphate triphosphohydrolase [Microbacteriaceae bacterium]NBR24120.1 deoxyguanosinetriphosphate triphosphohydrolase [Micrococcales bacterium]NBS85544.1 deoxyguanosinetriphosphate triphosphohydrolase [Micrococcales bacterium]
MAEYSDFDRERFLTESGTSRSARTEFARDRARVTHSSALRRLGAKTQVLAPGAGDFARTRLTHSLEVAQVGREMAVEFGIDPDVVDTACLAHDLGHPPFGHNGEKALNEWSQDFGGFEGNAQTLRLITRIEQKVYDSNGQSFGLNLTRATLDACCKYPWTREFAVNDTGADRSVKFGVYEDDVPIFNWIREGAPDRLKCFEAQIMDFSDDVAYSVHDFEDAIVEGFIQLEELNVQANEDAIVTEIERWNGNRIPRHELVAAMNRLQANQFWLDSWQGEPIQAGQLKNLTSNVIGSFVSRTTEATFASNPGSSFARYAADVVVPPEVEAEIAIFKGLVSYFLMSARDRQTYYEWQRALLIELSNELLATNGEYLDPFSRIAWANAKDDVQKHRVIVDQIAVFTDAAALKLHNGLIGSKRRSF